MAHMKFYHQKALMDTIKSVEVLVDLHIDPTTYEKALELGFKPEEVDAEHTRVYIEKSNNDLIHYLDYKTE